MTATWTKIDTDYHGAAVRLVTIRAEKKQYLLFGYVELYPKDLPIPVAFNVGDKPWPIPHYNGNVSLAASVLPMPVAEALAWYEDAARGQLAIPLAKPVELIAPLFGIEPSLGRFSVGEEFPVIAPWRDGSRVHRLVPMQEPDEAVTTLAASSDAREWLITNVGIDPFEYEDWLATISLVAPDPLLAGVRHFRLEKTSASAERIVLQLRQRRYDGYPAADAGALKVIWLQERPSGWTDVKSCDFDTDGFAIMTPPEPVDKVGYAVTCPTRGLLRMKAPERWIRAVNMQINLVETILDVEVPSGGRRKDASRYQTKRLANTGGVIVGETLPVSGAVPLAQLRRKRKDRKQREQAPQRLFGVHDTDKSDLTAEKLVLKRREAEDYVARLVAQASGRVIFVDPEFGIREFQNYALRVESKHVQVTVLTGAPRMRKARSGEEADDIEIATASPGVELLRHLETTEKKLGKASMQIFVMPGSRKPVFHDRFLVVDSIVWALGPSFNELGERIGLISKVHEPDIVIAAIERVIKNATPLATWVTTPESASNASTDGDDV